MVSTKSFLSSTIIAHGSSFMHYKTFLCTVERDETGPVIVQAPGNFTKPLFEAVNLTCAADGYPPPVFQWYRDGVLIPNAVQSFYYIDQLTPDLRGYYTCEAINNQGDVTSSPGLVTIQSEFNIFCLTSVHNEFVFTVIHRSR